MARGIKYTIVTHQSRHLFPFFKPKPRTSTLAVESHLISMMYTTCLFHIRMANDMYLLPVEVLLAIFASLSKQDLAAL